MNSAQRSFGVFEFALAAILAGASGCQGPAFPGDPRAQAGWTTKLVKDLNSDPVPLAPAHLASMNGVLLFSGVEQQFGRELWRSGGTGEGTFRIKDLSPGVPGSELHSITADGARAFFAARDTDSQPHGLFVTDGTEAGTRRIPGPVLSPSRTRFLSLGGAVYFHASKPGAGSELWISDGTDQGTRMVADLCPGDCAGVPNLDHAATVGGTLYFAGEDATPGTTLWRSDGTADGTARVLASDGAAVRRPQDLAELNGILYFSASDDAHGSELWRSDGTQAGTVLLEDLVPGPTSSVPTGLVIANGTLFFVAYEQATFLEDRLWRSDGTAEGTFPVSGAARYVRPTAAGGLVFFSSSPQGSLARSDGTPEGTWSLTSSTPHYPVRLFAAGSRVFFSSDNRELWVSDGSSVLRLFDRLIDEKTPIVDLGGVAYFSALEGSLWRSDGTTEGSRRITPNAWPTASSGVLSAGVLGRELVFVAADGRRTALFKSDGTSDGTVALADEADGWLMVTEDRAFFSSSLGGRWWRTDGTPGAAMPAVFGPEWDPYGPRYSWMTDLIYPGPSGFWRTDGTAEGTRLLLAGAWQVLLCTREAIYLTRPTTGLELVRVERGSGAVTVVGQIASRHTARIPAAAVDGDALHFAVVEENQSVLWKLQWNVDALSRTRFVVGGVDTLAAADGQLFFVAREEAGRALWRTDGTDEGTRRLLPSATGGDTTEVDFVLRRVGNGIVFAAAPGPPVRGVPWERSLWRSDGTVEGTVQLAELRLAVDDPYPDYDRRFPVWFHQDGGLLFFEAHDAEGKGIWLTDGTEEGTRRVVASEDAALLAVAQGQVWYTASDPLHGNELRIAESDFAEPTGGCASTAARGAMPLLALVAVLALRRRSPTRTGPSQSP